jgi:hypothetical protein
MSVTRIHLCHATGCETATPPRWFMCKPHWRLVPPNLRDAVWRTYRPGQELDKLPSREYLEAVRAARAAVAALEGHTQP